MNTERKELAFIFIMLTIIMAGNIIFQWLLVNDIYSPGTAVLLQLEKLLRAAMMLRFLYVVAVIGLAFLYPSQKNRDKSLKWVYTTITLILAAVLILGFSSVLRWYNLLLFPIVFISFTIMTIATVGFFF